MLAALLGILISRAAAAVILSEAGGIVSRCSSCTKAKTVMDGAHEKWMDKLSACHTCMSIHADNKQAWRFCKYEPPKACKGIQALDLPMKTLQPIVKCHMCLQEKLKELDAAVKKSLTEVSFVPSTYWDSSQTYWDKTHLTQTNIVQAWLRNKKMHKIHFIRQCSSCAAVKKTKGKWAHDLKSCHACLDVGAAKLDWNACHSCKSIKMLIVPWDSKNSMLRCHRCLQKKIDTVHLALKQSFTDVSPFNDKTRKIAGDYWDNVMELIGKGNEIKQSKIFKEGSKKDTAPKATPAPTHSPTPTYSRAPTRHPTPLPSLSPTEGPWGGESDGKLSWKDDVFHGDEREVIERIHRRERRRHYKVLGTDICEMSDLDEKECDDAGCCQWDHGACWSAVGSGFCIPQPTPQLTRRPTHSPTHPPTNAPTSPTTSPTVPTPSPTHPTRYPTRHPTIAIPTPSPTAACPECES